MLIYLSQSVRCEFPSAACISLPFPQLLSTSLQHFTPDGGRPCQPTKPCPVSIACAAFVSIALRSTGFEVHRKRKGAAFCINMLDFLVIIDIVSFSPDPPYSFPLTVRGLTPSFLNPPHWFSFKQICPHLDRLFHRTSSYPFPRQGPSSISCFFADHPWLPPAPSPR